MFKYKIKKIHYNTIFPNPNDNDYNSCIIIFSDEKDNLFELFFEKLLNNVTIDIKVLLDNFSIVSPYPNHEVQIHSESDVISINDISYVLIDLTHRKKMTREEIEEKTWL